MRLNRVAVTGLSAALVVGATLLAAPSASADQIWYQGVARASADAPCPASSDDDLKAGWSEWAGSWAQWANGGRGGYVCTRAITWAYEDTGDGSNCVLVNTAEVPGGPYYVNFGSAWSVAKGSSVDAYHDAACTDFAQTYTDIEYDVVLAPGGEEQAQARCELAFGSDMVAWHLPGGYVGPAIWFCFTEDEIPEVGP